MIPIYLFIALLIIIILYFINSYLNQNIESFRANRTYSANYILDDCQHNWARINKTTRDACKNDAWVKDPRNLCGICGNDNIPLISILSSEESDNPNFYGCNKGQMNSIGLNWNNSNLSKLTSNDAFLSDILTCNKLNKGSTADMYLFIQSTSPPTIIINNNITLSNKTKHNNYSYSYYYQNVPYNTLFKISVSGSNSGFGISYIWNKQLFILDHNGYQNSANVIKYYLNAKHLWGNSNNGFPDKGMLPWMNNWLIMDMNASNPPSTLTIAFNIGHAQRVGTMNNDLTAWIGTTNFGEVLVNNKNFYGNISNLWGNSVIEMVVPNISNGNTLTVNTSSAGFLNTCVSITFIWHGIVFSFPSTLVGFNNVIQQLSWNPYKNISFSSVKYCDLPIVYNEDAGPCEGCDSNNFCILEQTYYNGCSFVTPSNNLLFNTTWMYTNTSVAPYCACCEVNCSSGTCSCDQDCYVCNQMSNLSYNINISDIIFTPPENNYV